MPAAPQRGVARGGAQDAPGTSSPFPGWIFGVRHRSHLRRKEFPVRPLLLLTTGVPFPTLALVARAAPPPKPPPGKEAPNTRSLEVQALQALHQPDLTGAQLEALAKVAGDTAGKLGDRKPAKASDKYRKLLVDLRDAYLKGDSERIGELNDQKD